MRFWIESVVVGIVIGGLGVLLAGGLSGWNNTMQIVTIIGVGLTIGAIHFGISRIGQKPERRRS